MTEKKEENTNSKINEDLYSRQIIFLGMETMEKISQLKVLIIGLRGLGIEIAKNLIVSGPNIVTVFDPNKVVIEDLGANFYLNENDIGKRRDQACLSKLKKLNKYVNVDYLKDIESFKNLKNIKDILINNYKVIVISEIISKNIISFLDIISRENKICLIYSVVFGLSSFVFTDFGPKFTIYDETCFEKRKFFIKKIEKSENGLVEIEWNKKRSPNIRNYVLFKEIKGMTEINYNERNKKIFKIEPKSDTEFYIGNTLNYHDYISGGYIEETVPPKDISYESFLNNLEEPFSNDDYVNHKKKFIFLVFKAIMEFYDKKERLPLPYKESDYEEIKLITKNIISGINYDNSKSFEKGEIIFDENIIRNICFTCSAETVFITSFIGGIICQEIIKTTGKFIPINQIKIFDFLQYSTIIPESSKNSKNNKVKTKYSDLVYIFGEEVVEKIRNLNIFLAGAGAVGCELLKNLSLLGISNSVLVIDDDNIEISNLNRQFLFHEEHKGLSKAKIACESAKVFNSDLKCNYINKRISPENKDIFNKEYFNNVDFVLGAIDSKQGNYYLVKQCELFEKIFIKGGTKGTQGKVETFIPNITCSFNDLNLGVEEEEEKSPSCTRRDFPGKIEDCLDNARDIFDEYFNVSIIDILNILNDKNDINNERLKLEIKSSMNKFNFIKQIFYFIKFNGQDLDEELIKFGFKEFYKLFTEDIKTIYKLHPLNDTEESKIFWKNKRIPSELCFNTEDELCIDFLFYFLRIFTSLFNWNLTLTKNRDYFKNKLNDVLINYNIRELYNENKISSHEELLYEILSGKKEVLKNTELYKNINKMESINFEKDISEQVHLQFVYSLANLKAKSYSIPCCDKFYALKYICKIAPTSITSTATVSGFMCLQMVGALINQMFFWDKKKNLSYEYEEDDEELIDNALHNLTFNLLNNNFNLEALYDQRYNEILKCNALIPEKFSRWYKILEKGNKSIEDFNNYIKQKYNIDITLILAAEDDRIIYEKVPFKKLNVRTKKKIKKMEELKKLKLEEVFFDTALEINKNYDKDNYIFLKIRGFNKDNKYCELPVIKIE